MIKHENKKMNSLADSLAEQIPYLQSLKLTESLTFQKSTIPSLKSLNAPIKTIERFNCDDFEGLDLVYQDDLSPFLQFGRMLWCGECTYSSDGRHFRTTYAVNGSNDYSREVDSSTTFNFNDELSALSDHLTDNQKKEFEEGVSVGRFTKHYAPNYPAVLVAFEVGLIARIDGLYKFNRTGKKQRSTKSRSELCPNCGLMNHRLIRLEKLKLPKEAYDKTICTLEDLGRDNPNLINTLMEVATNNKGLYLYGSYGVGKTHVAYGLIRRMIWKQNRKVKLINWCEYLQDIKRSYDQKVDNPQYDLFDGINTLVIDEFGGGVEQGKKISEWMRTMTSEILMEAHKKQVQTILVSNIDGPKHMNQLLERRVLNRLGTICPIKYKMNGDCRRADFFNN